MADGLLTSGDVAARLQVSSRTVERLVERGELAVVRVGRQLRFTEDDVAAYVAAQREVPAAVVQPKRRRVRARRGASFRDQLREVS